MNLDSSSAVTGELLDVVEGVLSEEGAETCWLFLSPFAGLSSEEEFMFVSLVA